MRTKRLNTRARVYARCARARARIFTKIYLVFSNLVCVSRLSFWYSGSALKLPQWTGYMFCGCWFSMEGERLWVMRLYLLAADETWKIIPINTMDHRWKVCLFMVSYQVVSLRKKTSCFILNSKGKKNLFLSIRFFKLIWTST